MTSPKIPENFAAILGDNLGNVERLFHLLGSEGLNAHKGYRHWDELTRYSPPAYLNMREWWLLLKMQRLAGRQEIGLKDRLGQLFTLSSSEFFAETLHRFDRGGRDAADEADFAKLHSRHEQLAVAALREEAIASAQLDGAATDAETGRELLRSGRQPRDHGERLILNTHRALEHIREIRAQPLTLSKLSDLHRRLTTDTLARPELAGQLRYPDDPRRDEFPAGRLLREPPPAEELPERIRAMLAFANGRAPEKFLHPLLRAMALHFWVIYDQRFAEGNGRLARALFFWSVLHAGYEIFDFLAPSCALRYAVAQYLRAFQYVETDDNDVTYFAAHIFDAIADAQRQERAEVRRQIAEMREAENLTLGQDWLNPRQRAVVTQALKHPGSRHILQEHARDHRLARQTARNDFTPLVRRGWFEEAKIGKALAFFPAPDLAEKIKTG
jgi:Fic family protein